MLSEVGLVVRPGGATTVQSANTIYLDLGCAQDLTGIPAVKLAAIIQTWLGTEA